MCVAISYNNTPKDFIVNLYCLRADIAAFRLVLFCFVHAIEWQSCGIKVLGKLIQFCRMKLNCVVLQTRREIVVFVSVTILDFTFLESNINGLF